MNDKKIDYLKLREYVPKRTANAVEGFFGDMIMADEMYVRSLLKIKNIGRKSLGDLVRGLREQGFNIGGDIPDPDARCSKTSRVEYLRHMLERNRISLASMREKFLRKRTFGKDLEDELRLLRRQGYGK